MDRAYVTHSRQKHLEDGEREAKREQREDGGKPRKAEAAECLSRRWQVRVCVHVCVGV